MAGYDVMTFKIFRDKKLLKTVVVPYTYDHATIFGQLARKFRSCTRIELTWKEKREMKNPADCRRAKCSS